MISLEPVGSKFVLSIILLFFSLVLGEIVWVNPFLVSDWEQSGDNVKGLLLNSVQFLDLLVPLLTSAWWLIMGGPTGRHDVWMEMAPGLGISDGFKVWSWENALNQGILVQNDDSLLLFVRLVLFSWDQNR